MGDAEDHYLSVGGLSIMEGPFGGRSLKRDCTRGLTGFDVGTRMPRSATGVAQTP